MRARITTILAALVFAAAAHAAQPTGEDVLVLMQTNEVHTVACRYPASQTVSSCSTSVIARVLKAADATPSGLVTTTAVSGTTDCNVTVSPDNGCGTAGCRAGNVYQVQTTATMSSGTKLNCDFRVDVYKLRFQPR